MSEIDPITGLPKDLLSFEDLNNEQKRISIIEKRVKGSKFVTQISGINSEKESESLFKDLKRELACGGTTRGTIIELQGKHRKKLGVIMKAKGYYEEHF